MDSRFVYRPEHWVDRGNYFLSNHPQGSAPWFFCRCFRLTASSMGAAADMNKFENKYQLALTLTKILIKEFPPDAKIRMAHGTKMEPVARDKYLAVRPGTQVEELGLAVPKWDSRIGASVDGDVLNSRGIIEIKCPMKMYWPMKKFYERCKDQGYQPSLLEHDHITDYYYVQMQANMKILEKDWCDYIIFATDDNKMCINRVAFNPDFWDNVLYPRLNYFLEQVLRPVFNLLLAIAPDFVASYLEINVEPLVWEDYATEHGLEHVLPALSNEAYWMPYRWELLCQSLHVRPWPGLPV